MMKIVTQKMLVGQGLDIFVTIAGEIRGYFMMVKSPVFAT
jgi:hypothetical protein